VVNTGFNKASLPWLLLLRERQSAALDGKSPPEELVNHKGHKGTQSDFSKLENFSGNQIVFVYPYWCSWPTLV
jgi:hypothetical protein